MSNESDANLEDSACTVQVLLYLRGKFTVKFNLWGKILMKIYGKISHLHGFTKWEKLIWDFFMGNCTILVIEHFHLKMGKIS